jgi:hypothetical protein
VAFALGVLEQLSPDARRIGIFRVMSGETYFRGQGVPWLGLAVSGAGASVMVYAGARRIARQDF